MSGSTSPAAVQATGIGRVFEAKGGPVTALVYADADRVLLAAAGSSLILANAGAGAIRAMLAGGVRCPTTTSAGRWFDAAAGLLGLKEVMRFEGQAAMLLEGLAVAHGPVEPAALRVSFSARVRNLFAATESRPSRRKRRTP